MLKGLVFVAAAAGLATSALAVVPVDPSYGLLFEVSTDGSNWTRDLGVDVSSGAKSVFFRVSSFFTPGTQVTTPDGTSNAVVFARFTGSNSMSNFGSGQNGDLVTNYQRDVPNGNAAFLQQSQSGGKRIFGQAGTPLSFASQLLLTLPTEPVFMTQIASGKITIGNNNLGAMVRTIVFTNNTFGSGATPGLSFYRDGSQQTGAPDNAGAPEFLFATIEVVPAPGAMALLGLGGLVAARRRRA
ncbi:MAG: PEP-CTERM sorting domain-containing protein [Phycisphaeraceae bacterium]|nr:PEP-CTERM sorting domain-containing protein [Phycisphaeraceae bacterium]